EQPRSGSLVLHQHSYGTWPIARDAPIVHFRSYAVSGMMSLWNAEGHERESNDGNTMVGLNIYQYKESIMAVQLTDIVESSQAERLAAGFVFTEGPVWHPEGYWLFVDVRASLIYRLVPGGQPEIFPPQTGRPPPTPFHPPRPPPIS